MAKTYFLPKVINNRLFRAFVVFKNRLFRHRRRRPSPSSQPPSSPSSSPSSPPALLSPKVRRGAIQPSSWLSPRPCARLTLTHALAVPGCLQWQAYTPACASYWSYGYDDARTSELVRAALRPLLRACCTWVHGYMVHGTYCTMHHTPCLYHTVLSTTEVRCGCSGAEAPTLALPSCLRRCPAASGGARSLRGHGAGPQARFVGGAVYKGLRRISPVPAGGN